MLCRVIHEITRSKWFHRWNHSSRRCRRRLKTKSYGKPLAAELRQQTSTRPKLLRPSDLVQACWFGRPGTLITWRQGNLKKAAALPLADRRRDNRIIPVAGYPVHPRAALRTPVIRVLQFLSYRSPCAVTEMRTSWCRSMDNLIWNLGPHHFRVRYDSDFTIFFIYMNSYTNK